MWRTVQPVLMEERDPPRPLYIHACDLLQPISTTDKPEQPEDKCAGALRCAQHVVSMEMRCNFPQVQ